MKKKKRTKLQNIEMTKGTPTYFNIGEAWLNGIDRLAQMDRIENMLHIISGYLNQYVSTPSHPDPAQSPDNEPENPPTSQ
jgi:hypothetical protein